MGDNIKIIQFAQDLEFVQLLANPNYLQYLSNSGYFDDPKFLNYLDYLSYFKEPEFLKFIVYNRGILFLDLLKSEAFRKELADINFISYLHESINKDWTQELTYK